ncbi:unnamed protein product [Clonostachys solani]|uniref:Uncharacterized protein n=1 Tax=Clonostachys solani TaxID=160281 RepID=A0A9N9W2D9_9HYPO|nr:unnamed protein product [Clonostachys solani]
MRFLQLTSIVGLLMQTQQTLCFTNPIRENAADPDIFYTDGHYHMTYTSGDRIEITRASVIEELRRGETKVIWTDSNEGRNDAMWAPEIHRVDGVWYMFYSSRAMDDKNSLRTRVLRGCDGPNPFDCDYSFQADLVPPPGKRGGKDGNDAWSIDGSYIVIPGKGRFHLVSMKDKNGVAAIAIAKLDTRNWTVDQWHVISSPDQAWEKKMGGGKSGLGINEAPFPLYHGDDIWITFSASHCKDAGYSLGLLKYNGGDPLQKSSWDKSGPVVSAAGGNYGVGHNAFFPSPDGKQVWNLFHATKKSEGSCGSDRFAMIQQVIFDKDSNPSFDQPRALDAEMAPPSGQ